MLRKEIKYTDYDGVERTEPFFFNLSKAELLEMQLSETGGLEKVIQKIIDTRDQPKLVELFKEIILKSYGEKSADGKRFIKKDKDGIPLNRYFEETEAYSVLFTELASDDVAAANFVKGIIPADIDIDTAMKELEKNNK